MKNYENSLGANITSNLMRCVFIAIALAITKKIRLSSHLFYLLFERNQFIEPTLSNKIKFAV
jgi:hypothetical protein